MGAMKNLRFELKTVYEQEGYPKIHFKKTEEWLNEKYFCDIDDGLTKEKRNEKLKEGQKHYDDFYKRNVTKRRSSPHTRWCFSEKHSGLLIL